MDFLEKPNLGKTTLEIFQECINGYTGNPTQPKSVRAAEAKRARLRKFCEAVELSAAQYDEGVPRVTFVEPPIPAEVSTKECRSELQKVYEEKFVPENEPGRDYYEAIRRTKECGRCPICGGAGGITHLDHYLPKSVYPTLCVHPNNLIPICSTCNTVKRAKENKLEDGMPLHLYFDRLPEKENLSGSLYTESYLVADLDDDFRPEFRIECPDDWASEWQIRLTSHMEMYDLTNRYRACVFSEYAMIINSWERQIDQSVERTAKKKNKPPKEFYTQMTEQERYLLKIQALTAVIQGNITACGDVNSWQYALYCALEDEEPRLAAWLEENKERVRSTAKKYEAEAKKKAEEADRILEEELLAVVS